MFEQLESIDVGYMTLSDDETRRCGLCTHFRATSGETGSECEKQEQGSCFGNPVTANGLCRMFTASAPRDAAV
jgi:hypothetical protein